ncbi:helix-turn-helix domain-containing protein [Streptomyces lushanensis]|uniref:helix-turn-helix domain-containing protein n=1 Tax=Streptomyces lushanensis TaxID=1434255 RepID=UPI00099FAB28|nr:helix-turn-helix transcriptional regulator [Streptomyces lushanensis]
MPQPPRQLEPGRSNRDWFGAELRHWRGQRGLTQDQLGALVHVSGDLIAKIEKAARACTPGLAEALDAALETGGVLGRALVRVLAEADNRTADVDSAAGTGRHDGSQLPDEAMLGPADGNEVRVPCRTAEGRIVIVTMPRRALLRERFAGAAFLAAGAPSGPTPHSTAFVPDNHPVQHLRQLRRTLVECDNLLGPRLVIETVGDHIGLIQRLRAEASGADRRALLQVQAEYAEFCGWLHQDAGDHQAARHWSDRALDWAHATGEAELVTYVMVRKAQLAGDMRDPTEAVDLAEAAQHLAPRHSRLQAMGAIYRAHGHALQGDSTACQRAYDTALKLVSDLNDDTPRRRGGWLNATYVQAQHAHSMSVLGHHSVAAEGFAQVIRAIPPTYRRDRGVYLSRASVAHARSGDPRQAAVVGLRALPIAAETGSARILSELSTLDMDLQRWHTVPEVIEFRDAFDGIVAHYA